MNQKERKKLISRLSEILTSRADSVAATAFGDGHRSKSLIAVIPRAVSEETVKVCLLDSANIEKLLEDEIPWDSPNED